MWRHSRGWLLGKWRGSAGLYVAAYGDPARICANRLLASWRQFMPDIPVMLATDKPSAFYHVPHGVPSVTIIEPERPDIGAREPKLRVYDLTPPEWEYVLYLDADTELLDTVDFLFEALAAGWDMVLTPNPGKYQSTRMMARPNNQEEVERTLALMGGDNGLQWNGGVFSFRRGETVKRVFDLWLDGWREARNQDQPALHRALFTQPIRAFTVGSEWNCSTRYSDGREGAVILHHQMEAREMTNKLPPNTPGDSQRAWELLKRERARGQVDETQRQARQHHRRSRYDAPGST